MRTNKQYVKQSKDRLVLKERFTYITVTVPTTICTLPALPYQTFPNSLETPWKYEEEIVSTSDKTFDCY